MFETHLDEKRKLDEAECKRMKQESGSFKNFLKMQQQVEERRFQLIQEQQRASNQLFFQMMSNFLYVAMPLPMFTHFIGNIIFKGEYYVKLFFLSFISCYFFTKIMHIVALILSCV